VGHLSLNGWGIYSLNGWASIGKLVFHLEICLKNAGLQGSTLSDHRMTTGLVPFNYQCGLLQRGWDHSPTKACFYLRSWAFCEAYSHLSYHCTG